MLEVRRLNHAYPGGPKVLRDLSFQISEGEKVALLGPNGAGKSTLLLRLTGAFFGEGEIVIDDLTVDRDSLQELRRRVGLVFQNPDDQLFSPTVQEDVAYGPLAHGLSSTEVEQRVSEALAAVNLTHARERFPQNLSGGEKKRAALATILVLRPLLLVLDEPVAGLDARARRSVISVLMERTGAALVATHDLELAAELTERALVLDEGELVYDGPIDRLLSDEALLYRHGLKA
jgi:cobalt/nickel transport system ATP-binding protein